MSNPNSNQKFVIWAPSYSENSGGVLLLHYLCHYLNLNDYHASIWHSGKLMRGGNAWSRIIFYYLKGLKRIFKGVSRTSPLLNTPLATHEDLIDAIVIYPETISGNPLRAPKVVRWFLHKPGYHNTRTNYADNELYFYIQSAFNDPVYTNSNAFPLYFTVMLEEFRQTNFGQRKGVCYILRKGRNRSILHDLSNGTIIDGMSHKDMAQVFNESEYCISYDMQTYYSSCAAYCGCKSIVIPEPGIDKEIWRPEKEFCYGIAYGEDDLDWAINTQAEMVEFTDSEQQKNLKKISKFADECIRYFDTPEFCTLSLKNER